MRRGITIPSEIGRINLSGSINWINPFDTPALMVFYNEGGVILYQHYIDKDIYTFPIIVEHLRNIPYTVSVKCLATGEIRKYSVNFDGEPQIKKEVIEKYVPGKSVVFAERIPPTEQVDGLYLGKGAVSFNVILVKDGVNYVQTVEEFISNCKK